MCFCVISCLGNQMLLWWSHWLYIVTSELRVYIHVYLGVHRDALWWSRCFARATVFGNCILLIVAPFILNLDAPSNAVEHGTPSLSSSYTGCSTTYPNTTHGCHQSHASEPRWQSQQCVMWGGSGGAGPHTAHLAAHDQRPMLHPICGQPGTILLRAGAQGHLQQVRHFTSTDIKHIRYMLLVII